MEDFFVLLHVSLFYLVDMPLSIHLVIIAVRLIRFVCWPGLWQSGSTEYNDLQTSFWKYPEMRLVHVDGSVLTEWGCSALIQDFIYKIDTCIVLHIGRMYRILGQGALKWHNKFSFPYCFTESLSKDNAHNSQKLSRLQYLQFAQHFIYSNLYKVIEAYTRTTCITHVTDELKLCTCSVLLKRYKQLFRHDTNDVEGAGRLHSSK